MRRLTLGAAAVLVYAAVLAYGISLAPELAGLLAVIAAIGGVLLVYALARDVPELLSWSLAPAGAVYAIGLAVHGRSVDEKAPLVAVALLLCGELAAWSLDERWRIGAEAAVLRRRAVAVGALVLAGLAASALVVGMAAAPAGRGVAWATLGAIGAVGAVAASVALLRRAD